MSELTVISLYLDIIYHVQEGTASLVFRSGDHILGTFSNGRLDGLVQETLEFCDLHNVRSRA